MVNQRTIPTATFRQLRRADWDRLWLQGLVWARYEARRYYGLAQMEREIVQTASGRGNPISAICRTI